MHQEETTIVNLNTPNIGAPNFIKQTILDFHAQRDPNTVIIRGFDSPLSPIAIYLDKIKAQN
jgi:hypothetical protein